MASSTTTISQFGGKLPYTEIQQGTRKRQHQIGTDSQQNNTRHQWPKQGGNVATRKQGNLIASWKINNPASNLNKSSTQSRHKIDNLELSLMKLPELAKQ